MGSFGIDYYLAIARFGLEVVKMYAVCNATQYRLGPLAQPVVLLLSSVLLLQLLWITSNPYYVLLQLLSTSSLKCTTSIQQQSVYVSKD